MEAMCKPMSWKDMPQEMVTPFRMLRTPFIGWLMISAANMFVNKMIPDMIVRKLTKEEFDYYKKPYPTVSSRKPVRVWPMEIPIEGKPKRVHEKIAAYGQWLTETKIPKLCLYAHPGAIIREEGVKYVEENIPNTKMIDIRDGRHYIQEDNPCQIGEEIAKWYQNI